MPDATMDPAVINQATAIAEALLPQLDDRIQKKLDARAESMATESFETFLRERGVLNAEGKFVAAPAATQPPAPDIHAAGRPYARFGEQLRDIIAAERGGVAPAGLGAIFAVTGMSEGASADGGFLLQDTFSREIFRRVNETGVVFGRIPANRRITLTGNSATIKLPGIDETSRADGSRWGGMLSYWLGEGETITATKPRFQRVGLELNKIAALSYMTSEQAQDTPVLEGLTFEGFAEEFGFQLDAGVVRGTGVGQPLGILTAPATVSVAKETGQAAATIVYENVVKMWSRMWGRSRQNAAWFINQDVEPQLSALSLAVGTGGIPVWLPAGGLSGTPFSTLFGRPVIPIEQCSTLGTAGDIILADMSQYWAIDKGTPNYASSIHVQFLTDEIAMRGTYRVDARPMWTSALTPYQGTNTLSPYITLATRA